MKWKHIGSLQTIFEVDWQEIVDVDEDWSMVASLEMASVHVSVSLVVVRPEPEHVMAAQRTVLENSGKIFRQIDEVVVLLKLLDIPCHVCVERLLIVFRYSLFCLLHLLGPKRIDEEWQALHFLDFVLSKILVLHNPLISDSSIQNGSVCRCLSMAHLLDGC
ncbi:hypothetical protein B9Z55_027561 [Caenorhabditis nigoni]|uniref:Uncharacterized protein n=1 Tax=Caenorhabditis nigoni TaxID=1611254 RepID=A0A2G5SF45_9PELO|nr:hypothetical protein B9Z55_027561 [Caenorhabditis nigoni]